jgi:membrane protein required for colicin V production
VSHVDVVLALLLVMFALQGWRRGLCREGFDLVGLVGGLIVAAASAISVADALASQGVPQLGALPIAIVLILGVAMVVARIVGNLFAQAMHAVLLGPVDHVAGIVFGVLKGAAYLGLVLIVLERLMPTSAMQLAIEGSVLGPTLMRVASGALAVGREIGSVASEV